MRKIGVVLIVLFVLMPASVASAHDPIILTAEQTTPARGPLLMDGTISFALALHGRGAAYAFGALGNDHFFHAVTHDGVCCNGPGAINSAGGVGDGGFDRSLCGGLKAQLIRGVFLNQVDVHPWAGNGANGKHDDADEKLSREGFHVRVTDYLSAFSPLTNAEASAKPFASRSLTMSALTACTTRCVPLQFLLASVVYPHLHVPIVKSPFSQTLSH